MSPRGYEAEISEDGLYRYWLERRDLWGPELELFGGASKKPEGWCTFVLLNPSTANAHVDDPTIRRCRGFATGLGAESFAVANLFAFRAPEPAMLLYCSDPVGPENDSAIRRALGTGGPVIVGWGAIGHKWLRELARPRVQLLVDLAVGTGKERLCLGTCANGQPRHPLFVPAGTVPVPWATKIP